MANGLLTGATKRLTFSSMKFQAEPPAGGLTSRRFSARARRAAAFTLIEVVIAALIVGLVFGGIINCYIQSGVRIQWTGYSLAAQNLAMEVLEQAKAASWDPTKNKNEVMAMNLMSTNYNSGTSTYTGYSTGVLDVPYAGTNFTLATNFVTVQLITGVGGQTNVSVQFVRVDTVWPFFLRGTNLFFTNTVATLMSPDDRQF
jgi:Tfp pilus assembly protein PilV